MCAVQINLLKDYGLVVNDVESFGNLFSTVAGRLMARYYLSFDIMKLFRKVTFCVYCVLRIKLY